MLKQHVTGLMAVHLRPPCHPAHIHTICVTLGVLVPSPSPSLRVAAPQQGAVIFLLLLSDRFSAKENQHLCLPDDAMKLNAKYAFVVSQKAMDILSGQLSWS